MNIPQKVGQLFVVGFAGSIINPEIKRIIQNFCPAGLRVTSGIMRTKDAIHDAYAGGDFGMSIYTKPSAGRKDFVKGILPPYITNSYYCDILNELKKIAVANGACIPIHATMDMEGNMSCDHTRGGIRLMPDPMGVARSGDPQMAYDVAWATGRQLRPLGVNWLHSPVLDVNTNPLNPEISTRSYSSDPARAAEFAVKAIAGYRDAGIIATGKHYPGRGESAQDAHHGLPVIDLSLEDFKKHLIPFKACIDAGIPAIMSAHTIYPCIDGENAATLSKKMLTGLLREELGFEGVVTTDAMEMGSILQLGPLEDSVLKSVLAGADLVLFREEAGAIDRLIERLIRAAETGELPTERLDEAVTRTLKLKYDYCLFKNGNLSDPVKAGDGIEDPQVQKIATKSARAACHILRDKKQVCPISTSKRILLIEQVNPIHLNINDSRIHPGIFWEKMLKLRDDVSMVETTMMFDENDQKRIMDRVDDADVIVVTNWYYRRNDFDDSFLEKLHLLGKPVVVVTNNPYPLTVKDEFETVIVTYSVSPESIEKVAELLLKG